MRPVVPVVPVAPAGPRRSGRSAAAAVVAVLALCLLASAALLGARPGPAAAAEPGGGAGTTGGGATSAPATDATTDSTTDPTGGATTDPTDQPTGQPTEEPTEGPTGEPTGEPTEEPTGEPTEEPTDPGSPVDGPALVQDAVLRWGLTNETNNAAHEPGAHNFLSAGRAVPPVGLHLREQQWAASAGDVAVEKWDGTRWRAATWAGLRTTSDGTAITDPAAGTFSNHQVVLRGGEGRLDRTAGTASISWTGTFTVLYYSGRSFFHVSDPVLTVTGGRGQLTGTVSGYASSREDPTVREPVAARTVTLADLGAVDLGAGSGFSVTPAYDGVRVTGTDQRTDVEHAGSFPQSFVDYMGLLGTGAFWYSSGSSTDAFKKALPVTVSYDASTPIDVPVPASPPATSPEVPRTEALAPPTRRSAPRAATAPVVPATPVAPGVPLAPTAAVLGTLPAAHDLVAASSSSSTRPTAAAGTDPLWWVGGALLLVAAALLSVPADRPLLPRRSGGTPSR